MLPVSKVHFDLTSVLTTLAQNAVVMETRGLTRCLLSEGTSKRGEKEMHLNTEGINMHEMFKHSDVCRPRATPWFMPNVDVVRKSKRANCENLSFCLFNIQSVVGKHSTAFSDKEGKSQNI